MDKPLVDRQLTLTELQLVLRAQIHSRRELIKDMVGKLYPQIVQAEIDKLEKPADVELQDNVTTFKIKG